MQRRRFFYQAGFHQRVQHQGHGLGRDPPVLDLPLEALDLLGSVLVHGRPGRSTDCALKVEISTASSRVHSPDVTCRQMRALSSVVVTEFCSFHPLLYSFSEQSVVEFQAISLSVFSEAIMSPTKGGR